MSLLFPPSTSRLKFRNWQDLDIEIFVSMNMNAAVMEFFPSVYSRDETIKSIDRIKRSFDINGFGLYALEKIEDSSFIGFTGFSIPRFESFFTPCVEIGWRLSFADWNQGFATEAAKACIDFGFSRLAFNVIHSFTSVLNVKSMHIMKKIGMHFAGTFDHPLIADGNKLKPHVIYRLDKENYSGYQSTFF